MFCVMHRMYDVDGLEGPIYLYPALLIFFFFLHSLFLLFTAQRATEGMFS